MEGRPVKKIIPEKIVKNRKVRRNLCYFLFLKPEKIMKYKEK